MARALPAWPTSPVVSVAWAEMPACSATVAWAATALPVPTVALAVWVAGCSVMAAQVVQAALRWMRCWPEAMAVLVEMPPV
ncbi:hypothetical protein BST15_11295 [Mycolicibacter arupensis]|uniref:Uncharacterized protein n=1 Tax=Mycolicibacter arupensis TaxID=342002 RepID=A0ABX3RTG1_9MYCO|nr:hypothetical protein BST15_11295 [Mycolicibacter arupensis]